MAIFILTPEEYLFNSAKNYAKSLEIILEVKFIE